MSEPYGAKGCTCWPNEDYNPWDDRTTQWHPNASCRLHGVLADLRPPRAETGTYRVVQPQKIVSPAEVEECPPGVHSMFDFCPGRAVCEDGYGPEDDEVLAEKCLSHDRWVPCRPCMAEWPDEDQVRAEVITGALCAEMWGPHEHIPGHDGSPVCLVSPDPAPVHSPSTTEEEPGVFAVCTAAVRGAWRSANRTWARLLG